MKHLVVLVLLISSISLCAQNSNNPAPGDGASEIYTGPIIDMHIHAFSEEAAGMFFGLEHPPTLRGETYEGVGSAKEQMEQTFARFEKHNIVKAMVANGELWHAQAPDIVMIGGANKSPDALRIQYEEGMLEVIGELAPFYRGTLANDPTVMPYFDLADELGIPVGFHILPGGPNAGLYRLPKMLGGMRAYNANPMQIEDVLINYPNVKVYIMHGGWPYIEDMKALMYAHPQLYVDIAVLNWILPEAEFHNYLRQLTNAGFGDRIMFGSDQMSWPQVIDIGIDAVNSASFLSLKQKEDIFYNNAAEFLGLSESEIARHKKSSTE